VANHIITAGLVLAAAVVIVWVRVLPLSLSGVDHSAVTHLVYRGADRREHVYLGDYDSYYWLRAARTYLQNGTVCDRIVDGQCHDDYTLAPVGGTVTYQHSLHVLSIAAAYRVLTWFHPGYPLAASAFWIPVVIGAFGALPAFAIGRHLAGRVGGLVAALSIGLNPLFLVRSIGSDNDVWNVVLPLCLMWAAIRAVGARHGARVLLYALAGVLVAGAHALTWRGWIFTYAVVLFGLLTNVIVVALRGARRRAKPSGTPPGLGRAAGAFALFTLVPLLGAGVAGGNAASILHLFGTYRGIMASGSTAGTAAAAQWPEALATVAELAHPSQAWVVTALGGTPYLFGAWLGALLLLLPRRRWHWYHFALLIGGNYLYAYLVTRAHLGRLPLVAVLALPLGVVMIVSALGDRSADEGEPGAALLVITWFVAALFLSFEGVRFVMLLVPPFGICLGVALGRLSEWLARQAVRLPASLAAIVVVVPILPCLFLYPLARSGYAAATSYTPRMNSAWWGTLTRIRAKTPRDTIVTTWWPYGYWAEYAADRRATVDGGSLPTHAPFWLARVLLTSDEQEAIGLLRMLACGSDATPTAEKDAGAYGRIVSHGANGVAAKALIVDLARCQRNDARELLIARGITDPLQNEILEATHCRPPPEVIILSTDMIGAPGWKSLGSQSLRRTQVDHPQSHPSTADAAARPSLAAPEEAFLTRTWMACHPTGRDRQMICPLNIPARYAVGVLESFVYSRDAALQGHLRWVAARGAPVQERAAGTIVVATADRLERVVSDSPISDRLAVLVDVPNDRVLVGTPRLLQSQFTQLLFLNGRFARYLRKFDDRVGYKGERVATWMVDWQ